MCHRQPVDKQKRRFELKLKISTSRSDEFYYTSEFRLECNCKWWYEVPHKNINHCIRKVYSSAYTDIPSTRFRNKVQMPIQQKSRISNKICCWRSGLHQNSFFNLKFSLHKFYVTPNSHRGRFQVPTFRNPARLQFIFCLKIQQTFMLISERQRITHTRRNVFHDFWLFLETAELHQNWQGRGRITLRWITTLKASEDGKQIQMVCNRVHWRCLSKR